MSRVTRHRLNNGLTVLLEPMHDAPVVALQAWVNVGAADEAPPHLGIAHLHEHMLFKGTRTRSVGQIARDVEEVGGEINAWTSFDQTVYHVTMAAGDAERGVDILADALTASSFDANELAREIEVVTEEIRRAKDAPTRRLANALFATRYRAHPYRRPVLGTEASVTGIDREAMLQFFYTHYRPDNVTFVAAGDFKAPELLRVLEHHLGTWQPQAQVRGGVRPSSGVRRTPEPDTPAAPAERIVILREDVKEARLSVAWPAPGLRHADVAALDVLTTILGAGEASRLYDQVVRRDVANEVHAYAYTPKDPGLIAVGASLRPGRVGPVLEALLQVSYDMRHTPVAPDELTRARAMLLAESAYQRETVEGQANKRGFFEAVAGDYAYEDAYIETLRQVDADAVARVARRYLHAQPTIVAQVPAEAAHEAEAAGAPGVGDASTAAGAALGPCTNGALTAAGLTVDGLTQHVEAAFAASAARAPTASPRVSMPPTVQRGALGVQTYTFDNGATLLVRVEQGPIVGMRAAALGGQRWETTAHAGLGQTFASVWGLATQDMSPRALAARVDSLGGSLSAFVGRSSMGLQGEFLSEHAVAGLDLFREVLVAPRFLAEDFVRERGLLRERVRTREDRPVNVAFEAFCAHLFSGHAYGLPALGTDASLQGLELAQMHEMHRTLAAPERFVVCVTGAVDAEVVFAALAPAFTGPAQATIPDPAAPPAPFVAPPGAASFRIGLAREQAHCIVGGRGPSLYDAGRFGVDVLCAVLSGQSGRLFTDLRDVQSLAYTVSCSHVQYVDAGQIFVYIGCAFGKVTQALAGVYAHLTRLRQVPITEAELRRAQRYLIGSHAIDLQRSGARAMSMALNARYGLGYDAMARYPDAIRQVTVADVQKLAEQWLAPERLLEVVVGPEDVP